MSLEILAKALSYLCGDTPSPPGPVPMPPIPMTSATPMVFRLPSSGSRPQTNAAARTIFIIGAPGAGKGTQSAFLVAAYGLQHLSYGDLMRRLRSDGDAVVSALGTKPGTNNPVVPDDLGAWLIWKEIRRHCAAAAAASARGTGESEPEPESSSSWLIDGFPRRVRQVEEWLDLLGPADLALYLKCPVDVSARRVAGRGAMAGTGARPEDLDAAVAGRRIGEFYKNADLVVAKLKERGIAVVEVDTDRSELEIRRDLDKIMEGLGIPRSADLKE